METIRTVLVSAFDCLKKSLAIVHFAPKSGMMRAAVKKAGCLMKADTRSWRSAE